MLDRCAQNVSFLLVCLIMTAGVHADGRVFLMDLKNSSGLQGFRDAEEACATQNARLASAEELHHAVVECSFSPCTRGWLHGGTVGTTVCNFVGTSLKAVDVRTENATADSAHLDAFCVKDKGVPCGDPPSFPNARLQGHTGYEMGDELLYACVPGYVMPSGHAAFSLLCDSCGEWYGMVQLCVKDETEGHVDYEDKFTNAYEEAERNNKEQKPEEALSEIFEVVRGKAVPQEKRQQEASFSVLAGEVHRDQRGEEGDQVEEVKDDAKAEEGEEEQAREDSAGRPSLEQAGQQPVKADVTESPVPLLSQKHLFWFPSEAFQEQGLPASTNPVTQSTHIAPKGQSEESKEEQSREQHHLRPIDLDEQDHDGDNVGDHDRDDHDDEDDDSHHVDKDIYRKTQETNRGGHEHDGDDDESHQDEDGDVERVKHYIPARYDDLDRRGHYQTDDDHDEHYDMGEHEDERERIRYGNQGDYDDQHHDVEDQDHESYEDHDDGTDDGEHSKGHPDGDDRHYEVSEGEDEDDSYDHDDHDDHEHDDHDVYNSRDDHESHEDSDGQRHMIFPMVTDVHPNFTQKGDGQPQVPATTDETWLDGYPVVVEGTDDSDSKEESAESNEKERGLVATATDKPNEVEGQRHVSTNGHTEVPQAASEEPDKAREGEEATAGPSHDSSEPSHSLSHPDTLDYDTQQVAPTQSWHGDLTEHPFLDHGPAPPLHEGDAFAGSDGLGSEHLPGEVGERGEVEGERGETVCTEDSCPPHPPSASSRGPTVAAIIVAVCAVATAVIIGAWCYRRQQQKSSMYQMNGKGQSQSRHGQHIEMQQKV